MDSSIPTPTTPTTTLTTAIPRKSFQPRGYQIEVFEVARERNTIAVLDTGTGKTMIAVMLIRETGTRVRESGGKVLIVFLAPTVDLVHQQYEVIRDYTEFNVVEYYGDKGVDEWTDGWWKKEVDTNEIMVMTPQIFLDALRHGFMALHMVNLLIFDECHRANGNHPYTNIMKEYFHRLEHKPAIFGMTASPVIRRGVSSAEDCEKQISELESILDSKIHASKDRAEIEKFAPSAKEIHKYYDFNKFHFEDLKTKLDCLQAKVDGLLVNLENSPSHQFKDTNDALKAARKRLLSYHQKILYCLDDLGLVCACEAAKICVENVTVLHDPEECDFYFSYLKEALHIVEETLPYDYKQTDTDRGNLNGRKMGLISPKLNELIQILLSFRSSRDVLCLIFVERIIAARVIERFMKQISNLSELSISYLTGGNSSKDALTAKMRRTTLDMFRSGKVNLMFTTDVAEEGLHVPNCSWVIRYDLPKTVRSYVQSRGRARQSNSHYVLMIERGNAEQIEQLFGIIRSEFFLKSSASCRDPTSCIPKVIFEELIAYTVVTTGATVTADSSISLIYRYCEKLPRDRFFVPQPTFQVYMKEGLCECILILPPNAVFQRIVGPLSINSHVAKQLASLEACKKLHELGALNDHLLPYVEEPLEASITGIEKEYASGAGTTKRKELHGMACIRALSGSWAHEPDSNITLNAYEIKFVCDQEGDNYSGFVLLLESSLDDDVAKMEIELFLIPNKKVNSCVSPCGRVQLSSDQVKKSKLFQEFFFNGLFGKLITGSRSSGVAREFLFKEGKRISWNSLKMYLLLPIKSPSVTSSDTPCIHWEGVDACVSLVYFLRKVYAVNGEYHRRSQLDCNSSSNGQEIDSLETLDIIHLANKSINPQHLKDSVVLAVHTGRLYSVLDVINDITAECPFDGVHGANKSLFNSYVDYYFQKFDILLQHPGQPLLLLKQSHNPHNLFFSKAKFEDNSTGGNLVAEKEQVHAQIPPELLVHTDIPNDVLKSFYLLPSVVHRLESLMLASQLRAEIGCRDSTSRIPCSLILEAISTSRCCENFSLERLELLGDSVLKYALSCHLFLKWPSKHEGQLSDLRSNAVCNLMLHKIGTGCSLQGYIRDCAFDPCRWVAPGQISLRPVPCECGVESSEVPLDKVYITEDTSVVVGVACDRGHRWMCSKTIADCVEALIGAYYIGGGLTAAVSVMKWLGIDVSFETVLVEEAKANASRMCSKLKEIEKLESIIGYKFSVKGLLLEAITHPSQQELGISYCYQRLEFLGDSALDLVITTDLYKSHASIGPGELTDLRSASVNNEIFAQAAVSHNLQQYLQHGSGELLGKIEEYVKYISEYQQDNKFISNSGLQGPKVLGDLVESIAGAILIDTYLDLNKVSEVFKPLLSPMITRDRLELPPLRELIELCSHLGYFINTTCRKDGDKVVALLTVQLEDDLLVGHGYDKNRKAAKAHAALCLLKELKKRGISHAEYASKRKDCRNIPNNEVNNSATSVDKSKSNFFKKPKMTERFLQSGPSALEDQSQKITTAVPMEPVILRVKMQKGGPRVALFALCRIHQWPMPKVEFSEQKFREPIILDGAVTTNFNLFTSHITLKIPNTCVLELVGNPKTDKKSANDAAAFVMLLELQKRGACIIEEQ